MGRWLVGKELLLGQGFPVRAWMSTPRTRIERRCCSFCEKQQTEEELDRKVRSLGELAGNSMNLSIPCAIMIWAVCFTERLDQTTWGCSKCHARHISNKA